MINRTYDKLTTDEVKANLSSHAVLNHLDLSKKDIMRRFLDGMIKGENGYTYDNVKPKYISWWNNKKVMLAYITAALNNKNNIAKIHDWLKYWSKEDGYVFELTCSTAVPVGQFVYKYDNWEKGIDTTKFKVILELESVGDVENAGFRIKTAYPVPVQ